MSGKLYWIAVWIGEMGWFEQATSHSFARCMDFIRVNLVGERVRLTGCGVSEYWSAYPRR